MDNGKGGSLDTKTQFMAVYRIYLFKRFIATVDLSVNPYEEGDKKICMRNALYNIKIS